MDGNKFNEESLNHIENLKIAVNDSDRVALNKDFMRHAHTLNSISKTVNMFKLASFAELLEDISNMVMDKDLIEEFWINKPEMPKEKIFLHDTKSSKLKM